MEDFIFGMFSINESRIVHVLKRSWRERVHIPLEFFLGQGCRITNSYERYVIPPVFPETDKISTSRKKKQRPRNPRKQGCGHCPHPCFRSASSYFVIY